MLYESLLVAASLFLATFVFTAIFGSSLSPPLRHWLQFFLLIVMAAYFAWFWAHGGQTLAMKTWGLRLIAVDGQAISWAKALIRFGCAVISFALCGAGWWWMLFDREGCTLHDRICGTRIVVN